MTMDGADFPGIEALKAREKMTREWMLKGVGALLSLWSDPTGGAIRHTEDFDPENDLRPTATFHAVIGLAECGVWHPETTYDARRGRLRTIHGDVVCPTPPPSAVAILSGIVGMQAPASHRHVRHGAWVFEVMERSSHSRSEEKKPSSRFIIPLERLATALAALLQSMTDAQIEPFKDRILAGLGVAETELRKLLTRDGRPLNAAELYDSGEFAPWILLNVVSCFDSLEACYRRLDAEKARTIPTAEIEATYRQLRDATLRHVDYHMARHSVALDPSYDPVSLAFALRALVVVAPEERRFAFFRSCVEAIVVRQHQDGCWPDGISLTFEATADVVQQPSAGVALHLAECAIHNRSVTDYLENELPLLETALPALRRTMQYLRSTYTEVTIGGKTYSGWSSDRVRRRNYIETWITAYSTRLLRRLWIGEKAALRNHALTRFGIGEHQGEYRSVHGAAAAWQETIDDPDSLTRPTHVVFTRIIEPILSKRSAGDVFQTPRPDAVSFMLFGPPGSGKTYFVQKLADFLGWPLVTITPGHFIHRGLEFIEAVARDIFDNLRLLNHAIVFFDECDELFRTRDDESNRGGRSILSFATASMLPKLQELHDAANVVFVLGTNYLRNIDTAVRRPGRFDEILLFDRPDDEARARQIRRIIGASGGRNSQLAELTAATRGLTTKEVMRAAAAIVNKKSAPAETSLEDYREWCRHDGPDELQASRFEATTRDRIRARWSAFTH